MDVEEHLAQLDRDAAAAFALADEDTYTVALRVLEAIRPALHLTLTAAIADAVAEINDGLAAGAVPATVQLSTRGRELDFDIAAQAPTTPEPTVPLGAAAPLPDPDEGTSRITLRLPESVKARAERDAAAASVSLNTYIVNALRAAAASPTQPRRAGRTLTGWI